MEKHWFKDWKIQYYKVSILWKLTYKFNVIPANLQKSRQADTKIFANA